MDSDIIQKPTTQAIFSQLSNLITQFSQNSAALYKQDREFFSSLEKTLQEELLIVDDKLLDIKLDNFKKQIAIKKVFFDFLPEEEKTFVLNAEHILNGDIIPRKKEIIQQIQTVPSFQSENEKETTSTPEISEYPSTLTSTNVIFGQPQIPEPIYLATTPATAYPPSSSSTSSSYVTIDNELLARFARLNSNSNSSSNENQTDESLNTSIYTNNPPKYLTTSGESVEISEDFYPEYTGTIINTTSSFHHVPFNELPLIEKIQSMNLENQVRSKIQLSLETLCWLQTACHHLDHGFRSYSIDATLLFQRTNSLFTTLYPEIETTHQLLPVMKQTITNDVQSYIKSADIHGKYKILKLKIEELHRTVESIANLNPQLTKILKEDSQFKFLYEGHLKYYDNVQNDILRTLDPEAFHKKHQSQSASSCSQGNNFG